ncbi:MAG TPA: aldehyde ferredoxin oxidoreductase C-terminal domain-containing protein [Acidobacteriota bacterium]|nr:aldehyde ferredoxin oxidoreductase C-terminal domain-containing protein [Acidobacteriota bacterium]
MDFSRRPIQRGYTNRILCVDLDSEIISAPELDPQVRDYFLGGRSLGLYLLHKATTSKTKASDPENPLIIANGPLGGIPQFPGTAKAMAVSLSPLTGIPGVSNFGGHFGAYLKYAGFDALQVTGKAGRRVMIVIDSYAGTVTVEDAPPDDEAFDLERDLVERFTAAGYDKRHLAFLSTGIGAANTTYGCINSHYYDVTKPVDGHKGIFRVKQAGRTGIGTVMSDKKIESIVVLAANPHGENPYGAADWERVKRAGSKLHKVVREVDPQSLKMHRKGSAGLITFMSKEEYQSLPVHNFQAGSDSRAALICGKYYAEHLFDHRGNDGCFPGCNLQCTKGGCVTLKSGAHAGRRVWVDGPEYETAAGFGSNLGIWNAEFIMEANWHCDNYGIDTITTAGGMAFLMECFQRGYLIADDGEGLVLSWGDETSALEFIHRLAYGETAMGRAAGRGIKDLSDWVCEKYGSRTGKDVRQELEKFAMQAKGLPFTFYRTHRSLSMQGSYAAASDIGAHHAAAWLIKADLLGAFPTFEDKARALVSYPRVRLGNDNMGVCKLPWVDVFNPESSTHPGDIYINPASQEIYADFYNGVLGTNLDWEEIFAQTDRDINLQRVLNVLHYGRETGCHDWIPDRAIGPTDDLLYETEAAYNDSDLAKRPGTTLEDVKAMPTAQKRDMLMHQRKEQLRLLIQAYYQERGWNSCGIPLPETLKQLGLWEFLNEDAKSILTSLIS